MNYHVRATDCRTGWQVVCASKVVASFRLKASADGMAEALNQSARADRSALDPPESRPRGERSECDGFR